ncbi:hypothetical protein CVT26_015182 [Gymnopilus dilepis]|uniref:F-box domain-containing protein n=1 Tax=Gymnopilus dilepis TaxID=231916 RepID=A0A409WQR5_9AGAR|nr:hypothetical protein CVT26_015182 [Gymnopilus dilepis]
MSSKTTLPEVSLTALISSNTAPSESEKEATRTISKNLQSKLDSLNVEISGLLAIVEEKLRDRDSIQASLTAHQAVLHPIRSLPPEILSQIFCHCLAENVNPTISGLQIPNRPVPSAAPLLLARICRGWRKVALGTPQLWTALKLDIRANSTSNPWWQRQRVFLSLWMSRAGGLPMVMSVYIFGDISFSLLEYGTIRETFNRSSHRWKAIHWICSASKQIQDYVLPLLTAYAGRFPALETCSFNLSGSAGIPLRRYANPPNIIFRDACFFHNLPKLRNVQMDAVYASIWFALPCRRITSLTLVGHRHSPMSISVKECFHLIKACPLLETLNLRCGIVDNVEPGAAPIEHPLLKSFSVLFISVPYTQLPTTGLNVLFDQLVFPALQTLVIVSRGPTSRWAQVDSFTKFLSPMIGTLRRIEIQSLGPEGLAILPCLRLCANITHLSLELNHVDNAILSVFGPGQDGQLPFRYLKYLKIDGFFSCSSQAFNSFVKAVLGTNKESEEPCCLRHLILQCRRLPSPALPFTTQESADLLRSRIANGLDVQIYGELQPASAQCRFSFAAPALVAIPGQSQR